MRAQAFLARGLASGLLAAALLASIAPEAAAWGYRGRAHVHRAPGPTRLGPWVNEAWSGGWVYPDGWAYSAGLVGAYPATDEWYPWGYTAPFVRVGNKCVANEINVSPGGEYARYQRVRPAYYCNY